MISDVDKSLPLRIRNFTVVFGGILLFVYVFLPYLTDSIPILHRMSLQLEENGIDPSRYYYTDVEQVKEAELYLRSVLNTE
jgi:hypothetical protein